MTNRDLSFSDPALHCPRLKPTLPRAHASPRNSSPPAEIKMSVPKNSHKTTISITGCSHLDSLGAHLALTFLDAGYQVIARCRLMIDRIRFLEKRVCDGWHWISRLRRALRML